MIGFSSDFCVIFGKSVVFGKSVILGKSAVFGKSVISGKSVMSGVSLVLSRSFVLGESAAFGMIVSIGRCEKLSLTISPIAFPESYFMFDNGGTRSLGSSLSAVRGFTKD